MTSTTIEAVNPTDARPLFAFAFRGGLGQTLHNLAEADVAAGNADFVWAHLDLRDPAAQAWLRRRPWPPEIVEMVAAPIQRGRLFNTPDLVYGHLRDFRDEPDADTLQAGSLCVVASRSLIVTGRRIPLLSIEELRRRVEARTALPASPFGLITEFFKALNDIGEVCCRNAVNASTQWGRGCSGAKAPRSVRSSWRCGVGQSRLPATWPTSAPPCSSWRASGRH
jgi:hypothetical protein